MINQTVTYSLPWTKVRGRSLMKTCSMVDIYQKINIVCCVSLHTHTNTYCTHSSLESRSRSELVDVQIGNYVANRGRVTSVLSVYTDSCEIRCIITTSLVHFCLIYVFIHIKMTSGVSKGTVNILYCTLH